MVPLQRSTARVETYRKTDHKYGEADHVRQKFTGYQNDAETGLDFAEARMYENRHGRFTAVDPLLASGKSADPQTFDRYVYVMNNPLVLTDPTGLQAGVEPGELGSDENPYRVNTVARNWWSKIKEGFFQAVRALGLGNRGVEYQTAEEEIAERKQGGPGKQVGNALRNYAKGSEELYQAMEAGDPFAITALNRAVVNNSLGRASDEEVYSAAGSALLNTALTVAPGGKAGSVTVYISKNADDIVQYAGITSRFAKRAAEHLRRKGIDIDPLIPNLSKADGRAVEEALIVIHKLRDKEGGTLINKIHSISRENPEYAERLQRGYDLLKSIGY